MNIVDVFGAKLSQVTNLVSHQYPLHNHQTVINVNMKQTFETFGGPLEQHHHVC